MNNNHTDITIVLDRSGSMSSVAADTIGGFNRFLKDQQGAPGTAELTLHQFDNVFETPIPTRDVRKVPHLNGDSFQPRGGTALLDAMGRAIHETGARLAAMPEAQRAGKVVFVVITDGYENASREFSHTQVMEMVKHQREKYAWEFVYLGANQDAIKAGTGFGFAAANTMTYAHNAAGTQAMFSATSENLVKMRSGTKMDMSYEPEQIAAQEEAGAP